MKLAVGYPDVERATVDLLDGLMDEVTVGIGVPQGWKAGSAPHLQVAWDGTPTLDHPIAIHATVRVTAWHHTPTDAKALADTAHGRLLAHTGSGAIRAIQPLTGLLPVRDPDTQAELASFTVRATVRSTPL